MVGPLRRSLLCASLLLICSRAQATYSLIIADTRTGLLGSVGTSCTGSYAVSRISGIAPGRGAIHAQAQSNADGRDRGVEMLMSGATADEVIAAITAPTFDLFAASRQYGVVTLDGKSAGYTGASNMAYADDRQATFGDYVSSYQGNILTSAKVLEQLAASVQGGEGCDLPETLMLALEAGAANGEGDSRCTRNGIPADAGFLRVVADDGRELISIEVTSQTTKGAVVALRERFASWRSTHPCALSDAGAPAADAAVPRDAAVPADMDASRPAVPPALAHDAGRGDAAQARADAASPRDASTLRGDAALEQPEPPAARSSGCSTGPGERGGGLVGPLAVLGLALARRRARRARAARMAR